MRRRQCGKGCHVDGIEILRSSKNSENLEIGLDAFAQKKQLERVTAKLYEDSRCIFTAPNIWDI